MATDLKIGLRLKARRQELGLSLRELARRTDLSASFLSQVELDKTNLSLDSMWRIAEALDAPLMSFLEDKPAAAPPEAEPLPSPATSASETPGEFSPVVRSNFRPKLTLPPSGTSYELLTRELRRKMEAICRRLAPGTESVARRLREPTEEFIFVLSGSLRVQLDDGEYTLGRGDSIYFEGAKLKKIACASQTEEAVWISVITPPVL